MDQKKMIKPMQALTTIRSTINLLTKQVCVGIVYLLHYAHVQTIRMRFYCFPFFLSRLLGNTKGTTNSSKSNDDNEKNAKKSNDDSVEPGNSTSLGEIPKVEKYIANTRIDGLQTLYQVDKMIKFVWFSSNT